MKDGIATLIFWTFMVAAAAFLLWVRFRDGLFNDSDLLEKFLKVGLPIALTIALVSVVVAKAINSRR